jgi:hypothetical protein
VVSLIERFYDPNAGVLIIFVVCKIWGLHWL